MPLLLPARDNAAVQFGVRSLAITVTIVTPLLVIFAWFNMVLRLGLPPSLQVFAGPVLMAFLVSLVIAGLNTLNFVRLHATEQAKLRELNETQIEVILTLSEVAESRCGETGAHIKRVAEYCRLLAQLAGLGEDEVFLLKTAAPLHDLGKIGTPDHILLKPGKLTPEEYVVMQEHAEIGYRILADSTKPILKMAAVIARNHHEKWDGSGYPQRLRGEDIPLPGRIVAIADVLDALGTERIYKKAWSREQIRDFFQQQAGLHFDPRLTGLLLDHFERFEAIRKQYEA
ncbi:MAG: HD domain-containing protein [Hylemonella sp.]|nr:HD domain-containing protein [Hylemonella sp.]